MNVFIYALKCPVTGEVRYIGKTKDIAQRLRCHLYDKARNHRTHWIRSLMAAGQKPVLEILDEVPEEFWPQWEIAWIAYYQESGANLVNANAGGEGGHDPTPETRSKMSARNAGESHPLFGKHHSAETRARMSAARIGKPKSAETRLKMSKPKSLECRAAMVGRHPSEEACAKMSASAKRAWEKRKQKV